VERHLLRYVMKQCLQISLLIIPFLRISVSRSIKLNGQLNKRIEMNPEATGLE
jgi:hypothetical protein